MGTRSGAGTGWTGWTRAAAGAASGPRRQGHGERRPRAETQNGGRILNLNRTWTGRISTSSTRLILRSSRTAKAALHLHHRGDLHSSHFSMPYIILCEFVLAREMDGAVGTPNTRVLSLDLASPGLRSLAVSGLAGCNGQELDSNRKSIKSSHRKYSSCPESRDRQLSNLRKTAARVNTSGWVERNALTNIWTSRYRTPHMKHRTKETVKQSSR